MSFFLAYVNLIFIKAVQGLFSGPCLILTSARFPICILTDLYDHIGPCEPRLVEVFRSVFDVSYYFPEYSKVRESAPVVLHHCS
jgi:hypothetical protein